MNNSQIIDKLNTLLSNYQIFYQNVRGFHWNIQGKFFFELHAKYEELYTDAALKIDEIAERILTIGGVPFHSFQSYIDNSEVKPVKNVNDAETSVQSIADTLSFLISLEREIKELSAEAGDDATEDLMSSFIEVHEKTLWMYKAWLK